MARPVIAIMYDFDSTLSPKNMQDYGFVKDLGMTSAEFWQKTEEFGTVHNMEKILAYMYMMQHTAKEKGFSITKEYLMNIGKTVELFRGVDTWFDRINEYGKTLGIDVEHYIISSGLTDVINGTAIAKEFKAIFGCEYLFDPVTKEAIWPSLAINFTNKTQFLFRISKGALDHRDDHKVNSATLDSDRHVQYRNMIYIGDGMTDIPCMKLVKQNGGNAIALYQPKLRDRVLPLVVDERINYVCTADYSQNSALEKIVKMMLDSMTYMERLLSKEAAQLSNIERLLMKEKLELNENNS